MVRSFGNSVFQVVAILICTVLNAVLDPVFIHLMGFRGAAVATVLSQALCLVFMLAYLARKKFFHLRLRQFDKSLLLPFIAKGVPSAFQQSIPAISTILFYPAMAFNMALTSIVGQCTGAKRYDRARDYMKASLLSGTALLLVLSALVTVFARPLALLFVDSLQAAEIVAV